MAKITISRSALVVVLNDKPDHERIISQLLKRGDVKGKIFCDTIVFAICNSRDDCFKKLEAAKVKYFSENIVGTISLVVVDGEVDSSNTKGPITVLAGIRPEFINLYSSDHLSHHTRCDSRVKEEPVQYSQVQTPQSFSQSRSRSGWTHIDIEF
ncbi:MAG: hypothetical protein WC227_03050 [Patescibacteria group bacterium]